MGKRTKQDLLPVEQLAKDISPLIEKTALVYFQVELIRRTIELIGKHAEEIVRNPQDVDALTKILTSQVEALQKTTEEL